jgi:hypothetical protein
VSRRLLKIKICLSFLIDKKYEVFLGLHLKYVPKMFI